MDIEDEIQKFLLQQLVYVDDLHHAVLPQEIQDIHNKTFPCLPLPTMSEKCEDVGCCPRATNHTAGETDTAGVTDAPMTAPLPADEVLATRHLLHSEFGRQLCHLVMLRGAKVAYAFAQANLPTKPMITSLAGGIQELFIQEGVQSYTESLHVSAVPTFAQLASLPAPEGYQSSEPWYCTGRGRD